MMSLTPEDTLTSSGKLTSCLSMRVTSFPMDFYSKGQKPQSISQRSTPSDHTSAEVEQDSPLSTSGAMKIGDPTIVQVIALSCLRSLQKPKSPSLTIPLWKSTLSGFRSRCRMWASSSTAKATLSESNIGTALTYGIFPSFFMMSPSDPPSQYQQTITQLSGFLMSSMNLMMLGWWSLERAPIQFSMNSLSLGVFLNCSKPMILTAQFSLVSVCSPLQTLPYCPAPIFSWSAYEPMTLFIRQLQQYASLFDGSTLKRVVNSYSSLFQIKVLSSRSGITFTRLICDNH